MTLKKEEYEKLIATTKKIKDVSKEIIKEYIDAKIDKKTRAFWSVDGIKKETTLTVNGYKYTWKEAAAFRAQEYLVKLDACDEKQILHVQDLIDGCL